MPSDKIGKPDLPADIAALVEKTEEGGPHEWGYRCLATGEFIADDWPFQAADALAHLSAENERLRAAFGQIVLTALAAQTENPNR